MAAKAGKPSRAEIVDAAHALLAEHGPAGLSMRRVAERVGASYQVIYTRIGDKGALARALHDDGFRRLADLARARPPTGRREDLFALAHGYRRFAEEEPWLFELMFGAPIADFVRDADARAVAWESFDRCFVATTRAWLDRTFPERPRGLAASLAWRLWTAVHGLTMLHLAGHPSPTGDIAQDAETLVTQLLEGTDPTN
ncbi:MAG: TetR/AcrR family transcriptional regulator [Myxococcota bacterium]